MTASNSPVRRGTTPLGMAGARSWKCPGPRAELPREDGDALRAVRRRALPYMRHRGYGAGA